jgi:preprotein translocase subunit SecG
MQQILFLIHMLIGIAIIALVLMQQGKGSGMGAGFGSGASGTVFGSQGSLPFLFKLTIGCGAIFFATSLGIAVLIAHSPKQSPAVNLENNSSLPLSTNLPLNSTK